MSRTWRRDDSGRKNQGDALRNKRRNKYKNKHREDSVNRDSYERMKDAQAARRNFIPGYGLDTDSD